MDIKSSQTKTWYDQKARKIQFDVGRKVWFYNPRRKKGEPLSYRVVGRVHILLLENSMTWFTVFVGRTEAKIKLFTQIG